MNAVVAKPGTESAIVAFATVLLVGVWLTLILLNREHGLRTGRGVISALGIRGVMLLIFAALAVLTLVVNVARMAH